MTVQTSTLMSNSTREISDASTQYYENFCEGCTLPISKVNKQLKYVYDIFMKGESTGQKAVSEKVALEMRKIYIKGSKQFKQEEYLTASQIKSLFGRYTRQLKQGKLKEPPNVNIGIDETDYEEVQEIEPGVEIGNTIIESIFNDNHEFGDWVVVLYENNWYPGEVQEVTDSDVKLKWLYSIGRNQFKWPTQDDICWYEECNFEN